MTDKTPNPGSPEAIAQNCKCPRMNNRNGLGVYDDENGNPLFWISGDHFSWNVVEGGGK